jgi:anti-sigma B factor antagonist
MTRADEPPAEVVTVAGDVDLATAEDLTRHGRDALDRLDAGRPLVLDVAGVTFIDSSGLTALVRLRRAAAEKGSQVRLRAVPHSMRRLLELSGLADAFVLD